MKLIWKSIAALAIAGSAMTVAAAPAQAQYHGDGWQQDRGDHREWRGDRGEWRGDRGHWRGDRGRYWDRGRHYRGDWRDNQRRCWKEWRRGYHGQRVRVRICR